MNHYRCTRPWAYVGVPGSTDLGARQGYYRNAKTAEEAARDVQTDFPHERIDVQAWGVDGIRQGTHVGTLTCLGGWCDFF